MTLRDRLSAILDHEVLLASPEEYLLVRTAGIITGGANNVTVGMKVPTGVEWPSPPVAAAQKTLRNGSQTRSGWFFLQRMTAHLNDWKPTNPQNYYPVGRAY
jgi:hypothetical protein